MIQIQNQNIQLCKSILEGIFSLCPAFKFPTLRGSLSFHWWLGTDKYSATCAHTVGDLGCFIDTQVAHCLVPGRFHIIPVFIVSSDMLLAMVPLTHYQPAPCIHSLLGWMPRLWGYYTPLRCWTPPCSKYSGTLIFGRARSVRVYIPSPKERTFKILVDDANCLSRVLGQFTPSPKSHLSSRCALCEDSKISLHHKQMGVSRVELSLVEESHSLTWLQGANGVNFKMM